MMKLQYANHSPDTLPFIWFHVWPNAYRNDRTLYSEQLLENGDTRFYFSSKEQKGYLNQTGFPGEWHPGRYPGSPGIYRCDQINPAQTAFTGRQHIDIFLFSPADSV